MGTRVVPKSLSSPNKSVETETNSETLKEIMTASSAVSPTNTHSSGANTNLTLILEHSGHTNPITPMDSTPIDVVNSAKSTTRDAFRYDGYSDVEMIDSDNCGDDKVEDL